MKICIITSQYGHYWSGLGTYATNLINALADTGHEVSVVCPLSVNGEVHEKVRLIHISGMKIKPTLGNWFVLSYYFNKTLQSLLQRESFDIVHFTDARDSYFCKVNNTPIVGTMHDYYFVESSKSPFYYKTYYSDWIKRWLFYNFTRVMERRAVKRLSFVITNTHYVRETLIRNYFIERKHIKTIYLGVDKTQIQQEKESNMHELSGYPSILFVGANFQRKGLPVLMKAIDEVKESYPKISLYVIGKDSKESEMKILVKELGVERNVHFFGWKDNKEVRDVFQKVNIFAMPSIIEGFGLVFLEAMAAGTAVIGGDTGGTPELIENGVNGFLVKPGDWQDLSKKIRLLAEDRACQEKFIKNGYKTLEQYTVDRMVEETIDVYIKLQEEALS